MTIWRWQILIRFMYWMMYLLHRLIVMPDDSNSIKLQKILQDEYYEMGGKPGTL